MKINIKIIIGISLLLLVIITYLNHFNNGFHFDDSHTIVNNYSIHTLKNLPQFFKDPTTFSTLPANRSYRPLVTTANAIDYSIGNGLKPIFFHISIFIIFVLQGLLMFFFIKKIYKIAFSNNNIFYIALLTVAIYMLHPGISETINYIISRSDSYSTFFIIMALVMYVQSKFCRKWFLYLIPAILGALCKETGLMFPLFLFAYIYLFEKKLSVQEFFKKANRKNVFSAIKNVIPSVLIVIVLGFIIQNITYKTALSSGIEHSYSSTGIYHIKYILTQSYVLFHYFIQFFFPINLSSDPDIRVFDSFLNINFFAGILFMIIMFWVAIQTSKSEKLRPISFGIFWFFISAIPTSIIAALPEPANSHRLFLPYIGLSISVCWATYLFIEKIKPVFTLKTFNRIIVLLALSLIFICAYGTYQRNKVWKTDETLWCDIIQKSPNNGRALMNYGLCYMEKGRYLEAEYFYKKSLEISPYYSYANINMAILKAAQGNIPEAKTFFNNGLMYGKNIPDNYYFYARFLYNQKQYDEASSILLNALSLAPTYYNARYLLMSIYYETGNANKLKEIVNETMSMSPNDKTTLEYQKVLGTIQNRSEIAEKQANSNPTPEKYLDLSLVYYREGNYQKCIDVSKEALKLNPNYAEAYNNIGSAYNAMGKYQQGAEACLKALSIKPDFELAKNNLNWAKSEIAKKVLK